MQLSTRMDTRGAVVMSAVMVAFVAAAQLAAGVRPWPQGTVPAAVSVEREPRHRPVFENAFARVLEVRVPGGDTTLYHTHSNRMTIVVIKTAAAWSQALGGDQGPSVPGHPVGTVFDNLSDQLPYTHRVGNTDTGALHYVAGEWLGSPGSDGPKLSDTNVMKLEKESPLFRVYRITLPPGASAGRHQHLSPGMTVQVHDGRVTMKGSASRASGGGPGSGNWRWRAAGDSHTVYNAGTATVDIIEVDWLSGTQAQR